MSPMTALATVRSDIADYVSYLILVYVIMIFLYILLNMMFSLGLRMPYSRWFDAVMNFLRDVCEPYLRIFRRLIPTVGMIDFSPWLAIIVLFVVRAVIPPLISG
jgi:YggT family protein